MNSFSSILYQVLYQYGCTPGHCSRNVHVQNWPENGIDEIACWRDAHPTPCACTGVCVRTRAHGRGARARTVRRYRRTRVERVDEHRARVQHHQCALCARHEKLSDPSFSISLGYHSSVHGAHYRPRHLRRHVSLHHAIPRAGRRHRRGTVPSRH